MIKQAKFWYSLWEKNFEKQKKTIEDQGGKQRKELAESNEFIRKDFNIDRDNTSLEKQKNIFNEFI